MSALSAIPCFVLHALGSLRCRLTNSNATSVSVRLLFQEPQNPKLEFTVLLLILPSCSTIYSLDKDVAKVESGDKIKKESLAI